MSLATLWDLARILGVRGDADEQQMPVHESKEWAVVMEGITHASGSLSCGLQANYPFGLIYF